MTKLLSTLLLLAGFCLGAAISYFNWTAVTFDYLAGQAEMPLIAVLLAAFLLGLAVMGLLNFGRIWALQRDARKLQNRLSLAETELKNLRNIPLSSAAASGASGSAAQGPVHNAPAATPLKNA